MELFVENGFDATTVDQIATAAGISPRSFFRYFPTKEDVVIGDPMEYGVVLRAALEGRPAEEGAARAMGRALGAFVDSVDANPAALGVSTVMLKTPSLWAKHIEKQRVWVDLLLPDVRRRVGAAPHADLLATAIIEAALSTFHASLMYWAARGGSDDLGALLAAASAATADR